MAGEEACPGHSEGQWQRNSHLAQSQKTPLLLPLKGGVPRVVSGWCLGEWLGTSSPQTHQLGCLRPLLAGEEIPAKYPSSCITCGTDKHRHQVRWEGMEGLVTPVTASVWVGLPGRWFRSLEGPGHSQGSTRNSTQQCDPGPWFHQL